MRPRSIRETSARGVTLEAMLFSLSSQNLIAGVPWRLAVGASCHRGELSVKDVDLTTYLLQVVAEVAATGLSTCPA